MRRRQFLAAVAVGATLPLAGCSDPRGSIRLTDVGDDAALADRWAQPAVDLPEPYRDLVAGAVAGDADRATVTDTHPPFTPDRPVEYEGRYYDLGYAETDVWTETRYAVEVTANPDPPPERTVSFLDLPSVDQERFVDLLDPEREWDDGETVGAGIRYTDGEERSSVVVPDPEYDGVTRGETFAVVVTGSREVEVSEYRYRAAPLAADTAGLAALARERFRVSLPDLPADQRAVLDEAKGAEVRSEDPPSEGFAALVERFRAREARAVEATESGGTWLLRDDGADWWAEVRYPQPQG